MYDYMFVCILMLEAKHISSDFNSEIKTIEKTFLNAGYPKHFIFQTVNSVFNALPVDKVLIPSFRFVECKKVFIKFP